MKKKKAKMTEKEKAKRKADRIEHLQAIERLTRDMRAAAENMSVNEVRFLVDAYYTMQHDRIKAKNQLEALAKSGEPNAILDWYFVQSEILENSVRSALNVYSNSQELGRWARSIVGIGPVLSAGLLAHINVEKAPTCSSVWQFAGLTPGVEWKKGQKRPWNASLKTLCWKIGESFVKVSGKKGDVYGHVYAIRKDSEVKQDAAGEFADQAAAKLKKFKIGKDTDAYTSYIKGHLPPGHLHARAKRYAVKLFLSHYHAAGYWLRYHRLPPRPYAFDHLGHAHLIIPPNMNLLGGMEDAWNTENPSEGTDNETG